MEQLKSLIRNIPNFPKPGIQFKDITTLFEDRWGLKKCLDLMENRYRYEPIDKIAAIESRGFIVGAALADRLNCGLVIIRKKGKLPWKTVSQSYDLEYGTDELEMHVDSVKSGEKVLIVDDLLATGGTMSAAAGLAEKLGGKIIGLAVVIKFTGLGAEKKLEKYPLFSLLSYDEHSEC